jgi:hypothetical protein
VKRRKFSAESARLKAGRCNFDDETSLIATVNRPSVATTDNDHSMIHHYASIPDVFELTTTPLSHPSKGSPTVIEFAKAAGAGRHFCPPSTPASNLGDTCGDRYESAK